MRLDSVPLSEEKVQAKKTKVKIISKTESKTRFETQPSVKTLI
jgi:hypothetical protein